MLGGLNETICKTTTLGTLEEGIAVVTVVQGGICHEKLKLSTLGFTGGKALIRLGDIREDCMKDSI